MRYLSIAALLALTAPEMVRPETVVFTIADGGDPNPQATPYGQKTPRALPTPPPSGMALKWDKSVGFLLDNSYTEPSVWNVNCKDSKVCNAFEAVEFGRTLFVIADGDGPAGVGGPCDLGKLVRAVKAHYEYQHPPAYEASSCYSDGTGMLVCRDTEAKRSEPEDFLSWEVCGDEYLSNFGGTIMPTYNLVGAQVSRRDPKELREMADCIERREAKEKRRDAWLAKVQAKADAAEAELKTQLGRCEPKR